ACAMEGRMEEAIAAYREVVVLAPDHAEAHFRLGSLLSESGHIAEGFAHYMRRAALVHQSQANRKDKLQPAHRTKHDREQADYLAARHQAFAPFHLEDGGRLPGPAVNPANATPELVRQWQDSHPQMVVIDNFLTPAALEKLRN